MIKGVVVCGGRDLVDENYVFNILDYCAQWFAPGVVIIHGGARGADTLAGKWAHARGHLCVVIPANWHLYGKRAGHIRNGWLLDLNPDLVIALPGGVGTANMVKQTKQRGVLLYAV